MHLSKESALSRASLLLLSLSSSRSSKDSRTALLSELPLNVRLVLLSSSGHDNLNNALGQPTARPRRRLFLSSSRMPLK